MSRLHLCSTNAVEKEKKCLFPDERERFRKEKKSTKTFKKNNAIDSDDRSTRRQVEPDASAHLANPVLPTAAQQ